MVARSANRSSCYVCTMMPQSSSHHRLTIMTLNVLMSSCVSEFAVNPTSNVTSFFAPSNNSRYSSMSNRSCTDVIQNIKISRKDVIRVAYTIIPHTIEFVECYSSNGTVQLGQIPLRMCKSLFIPGHNNGLDFIPLVPCPYTEKDCSVADVD